MTEPLTRPTASAAVTDLGWRYLLGTFTTTVAVSSLEEGLTLANVAVLACVSDAEEHLCVDIRADRVEFTLQTRATGRVTERDAELAVAVTAALGALDADTRPTGRGRSIQQLEVAIDALDIPSIRPFWKAVLAYADEPGHSGPEDAIVDPVRQGPAVWFQQMDAPRPQRNRIHFDITVPHDEAEARLAAALEAGGTLVSDAHARAFWVLADAEGNEICICTWQDRD
jgi:4a-hydroxytetrahydrobiopterin dehydratase